MSPSSLHLLALQKEEEESDNSVAAITFLRCNATKKEEEGDDSVAADVFFTALRCSATLEEEEEGDDNVAAITFFIMMRCNVAPEEEEEGNGSRRLLRCVAL